MAEVEAKKSETHDGLEIAAAVLLGVAAVCMALATYQASVWGGEQDEALTTSVNEGNRAVDANQLADSTFATDQQLFIEMILDWRFESDPDDYLAVGAGEFILGSMSEDGEFLAREWFDNEAFLPFDDPYFDALYAPAEEATVASDAAFRAAQEAGDNGDEFDRASILLTIVLFFAGISIVLNDDRVRRALVVAAAGVLLGSVVYLGTLDWTA